MHWTVYVLGAAALVAAAVYGWFVYNPPYEDEFDYHFDESEEDIGPQSEGYEFLGPQPHEEESNK